MPCLSREGCSRCQPIHAAERPDSVTRQPAWHARYDPWHASDIGEWIESVDAGFYSEQSAFKRSEIIRNRFASRYESAFKPGTHCSSIT